MLLCISLLISVDSGHGPVDSENRPASQPRIDLIDWIGHYSILFYSILLDTYIDTYIDKQIAYVFHFSYFDWFGYFRKSLTIFRNKQIARNLTREQKDKHCAYVFSLLLCRLIWLSLHFCISAFPHFRKSEMQNCGNTKCRNRQIARNLKSEKT